MSENVSSQLISRLHEAWKRTQTLHFSSGLLAFLRWGIILFLIGMMIDWLTFMPTIGRVFIFLFIAVFAIYRGWVSGWKNLSSFNVRDAALQVEESMGDCKSLLVTAVQLSEDQSAKGYSKNLLDHTNQKAEEVSRGIDLKKVVPFSPLKGSFSASLVSVILIGLFAIVGTEFLGAGISRLFPPWQSIKYPTRTQVHLLTSELILKEGGEAKIEAKIGGVIPEEAKIILRTENGKSRTRSLPIVSGNCGYEIKAAYRDFDYQIQAGDDRSAWQTVKVISAPRIQDAQVSLVFPDYTLREPETMDALTMSLPEGTHVKWKLKLDRAVSEAYVSNNGGEPEKVGLSEDGLTVSMEKEAKSSSSYKFLWTEKSQGFTFESPNDYLQVQPDQEPQLELTFPEKNLIATLGREVRLAYRVRDDHGIGEAYICYRVNKLEEKKIKISLPKPDQTGETFVDWDYRKTLDKLEIGDTVTFVIEMADRYPGPDGPHRVRTQGRRLTILSEIEYLSHMAKQRNRLLSKIKSLYREEREVHDIVSDLDPISENFVQSCQLEVVRQELIRERMMVIKGKMIELREDLIANGFTEEKYTARLKRLEGEVDRIAKNYVARVSDELRKLSSSSMTRDKSVRPDTLPAIDAVNFAAREMGLMVLSLGFRTATEIMAREIDTIAKDQARMRLQTMLVGDPNIPTKEVLSKRQEALKKWLIRLLEEIPRDRESGRDDAIVAFKLSRLSKDLFRSSTDKNMEMASKAVLDDRTSEATTLQAEIIRSLLNAEFRLRSGLEYSALVKVEKVLQSQINKHESMKNEIESLSPESFVKKKGEYEKAQFEIAKDLNLLLLPSIPGAEYKLFDGTPPAIPDVNKALLSLEGAIKKSSKAISDGDHKLSTQSLGETKNSFGFLKTLVRERINQLMKSSRVSAMVGLSGARIRKIGGIEERLLLILEKTEDAEADEIDATYLAPQLELLSKDISRLCLQIKKETRAQSLDPETILSLIESLKEVELTIKNASGALRKKEVGDAIDLQSDVLDLFERIVASLTIEAEAGGSYATARSMADVASAPGPLLAEVMGEQYDMVKKAEGEDLESLPELAIPQKNLIHAVNAILASLDPLSHQIETGSVMVFAKEDMNAASEALAMKDIEEAIDAGSFVAESMQEILDQLNNFSPQYIYIREVSEYINERLLVLIRMSLQLQNIVGKLDRGVEKEDKENLGKIATSIANKFKDNANDLAKVIGSQKFVEPTASLVSGADLIGKDDEDGALENLEESLDMIERHITQLVDLQKLLVLLLGPPLSPVIKAEQAFVTDFVALATFQRDLFRRLSEFGKVDKGKIDKEFTDNLKSLDVFIKRYASLESPFIEKRASGLKQQYSRIRGTPKVPLETALKEEAQKLSAFFKKTMAMLNSSKESSTSALNQFKAGKVKAAAELQEKSKDSCRRFVIATTQQFFTVPGPPPEQPPAPSYDISEIDDISLSAAGAVRGQAIKGGRLEWQVLGRRERAALNENFARELPLEYRGLLKDYYERLAQ